MCLLLLQKLLKTLWTRSVLLNSHFKCSLGASVCSILAPSVLGWSISSLALFGSGASLFMFRIFLPSLWVVQQLVLSLLALFKGEVSLLMSHNYLFSLWMVHQLGLIPLVLIESVVKLFMVHTTHICLVLIILPNISLTTLSIKKIQSIKLIPFLFLGQLYFLITSLY